MIDKALKTKMEKFLEEVPLSRERRFKDKAIARILQKEHPRLSDYPIDNLIKVVQEALALDRYFRLTLKNRPELRGRDYYKDKHRLEKEHVIGLGYEIH